MRAWTYSRRGLPAKVLSLSTDIPKPSLASPKDVLVRISHAGLNQGGSIMMQLFPYMFRPAYTIAEMDFSGVVVEVGDEVPADRGLSPETQVFGSINVGSQMKLGRGALAEYVVVPASSLVKKPENIGLDQAAGLPVAGCTALELLKEAKLKPTDSVLINGASGGIGHMTVQMIKDALGADGSITAVCSGANVAMVKSFGVDEVIDYRANSPLHMYLASRFKDSPFDVIVDAHGVQEIWNNCPAYLRPGGRYVTVGPALPSYSISSMFYISYLMIRNLILPVFLGGVPREYVQVAGFENLESLQTLARICSEEKLRVHLDSTWDMEDVLKAYERVVSRRSRGRVIVKIQHL